MNHRAYEQELLHILSNIDETKRTDFITRYASQSQTPGLVFGFSVFLGGLGIDRFVLGQIGLGILKLFTLGGLGIWSIVDLFIVGGVARRQNIELARQIQGTLQK
ncbi:MAG: TM2 domain-containing protein [Alphaproteobacteria bacterium]